jgi:hypothetical protein
MWNFADLCTYLMPLAERVLNDVDKIVFAREFNVTEWLAPAYIKLCQRKERLTTEEARKLGIDSLLFISRFREEKLTPPDGVQATCVHCAESLYCRERDEGVFTLAPLPEENVAEEKVKSWLDNGCVV